MHIRNACALDADMVRVALGDVPYPGLSRDLVSFGMVRHVSVCGGQVKVQLALRTDDASIPDRLGAAIRDKLFAIGATLVAVEIVKPDPPRRPLPQAAQPGRRDHTCPTRGPNRYGLPACAT